MIYQSSKFTGDFFQNGVIAAKLILFIVAGAVVGRLSEDMILLITGVWSLSRPSPVSMPENPRL